MRRLRWPTALGALALVVMSCKKDPEVVERAIVIHAPASCAISQADAFSVFYAAGDFEPSPARPPQASANLREVGRQLEALPADARSIVVDVGQGDLNWRGIGGIRKEGAVDVLAWRNRQECELRQDLERRDEMAFGVVGRHFIVAGGRAQGGSQVPHTFVGDLTTGAITRLQFGLGKRRSFASVTAFGPRPSAAPSADAIPALIAGGEDPDSRLPIDTAEVYLPNPDAPGEVGDFEEVRLALSEGRSRHGAVVLATGQTLLVGGRSAAGPLRTMEIIDPTQRRAYTAGVALLAVPRIAPTVLRLASGEILVAGGVDANGTGVPTLEWFAPDATRPTKRPIDLAPGRERAYVPLDAGGALAVIAPESGSATPDFRTVWVISSDGTLAAAKPVEPGELDAVRLFPGEGGAPLLFTGRRWLRWSPWRGEFVAIEDTTSRGPIISALASGDLGLALWLDEGIEGGLFLHGLRFATRTPYDFVKKPLIVDGLDALTPDRLVDPTSTQSSIRFDAARGLELGSGASTFLTDMTFGDLDLEVAIVEGAAAALVVLRPDSGDELEVGGAGCAFAQSASKSLTVRRRGRRVEVVVDGAPARACPSLLSEGVRVALGLRGAQARNTSAVRNLVVTRR